MEPNTTCVNCGRETATKHAHLVCPEHQTGACRPYEHCQEVVGEFEGEPILCLKTTTILHEHTVCNTCGYYGCCHLDMNLKRDVKDLNIAPILGAIDVSKSTKQP